MFNEKRKKGNRFLRNPLFSIRIKRKKKKKGFHKKKLPETDILFFPNKLNVKKKKKNLHIQPLKRSRDKDF